MSNGHEPINSIDRALDILLLFQREGREMGVTQISAALGIYKSTVHRTLSTLEKRGFVQQNPDNGRYWLGIKLYSLGMLIREQLPIRNIAYPYAKDLAEKFNEVVHLAVNDYSAVYPTHTLLDKIHGHQMLAMTPPIGSSVPSHCSAMGKCLLAFSPRSVIDKYIGSLLPVFTEKTISNWDDFLRELELVKQQGYAIEDGELELGLTCVAAPIMAKNGEIIAALSLSGPTSRVKTRLAEIVAEVIKTTKQIADQLD